MSSRLIAHRAHEIELQEDIRWSCSGMVTGVQRGGLTSPHKPTPKYKKRKIKVFTDNQQTNVCSYNPSNINCFCCRNTFVPGWVRGCRSVGLASPHGPTPWITAYRCVSDSLLIQLMKYNCRCCRNTIVGCMRGWVRGCGGLSS